MIKSMFKWLFTHKLYCAGIAFIIGMIYQVIVINCRRAPECADFTTQIAELTQKSIDEEVARAFGTPIPGLIRVTEVTKFTELSEVIDHKIENNFRVCSYKFKVVPFGVGTPDSLGVERGEGRVTIQYELGNWVPYVEVHKY